MNKPHWVQLGFQKSVSNSHDEVQFTVNLSVIRRMNGLPTPRQART